MRFYQSRSECELMATLSPQSPVKHDVGEPEQSTLLKSTDLNYHSFSFTARTMFLNLEITQFHTFIHFNQHVGDTDHGPLAIIGQHQHGSVQPTFPNRCHTDFLMMCHELLLLKKKKKTEAVCLHVNKERWLHLCGAQDSSYWC